VVSCADARARVPRAGGRGSSSPGPA
jgi:hypothetical protein